MKTIQRSSRLVIRRYSHNNHNNRRCTSPPEQWRCFSMSPLTTPDQREQCLTIAPFFTNKTLLQVQQQSFYQPRRTMVTVTKTKVAELQPQDDGLDGISSSNNNTFSSPTYITHSDDLIVTPSCLNRVEKLVQMRQQKDGNDDPYFLRVFVDAGGCSGFQYQFEIDHTLDTEEDGTDVVIVSALLDHKDNNNNNGTQPDQYPRIVIDETSLGFLKGATLDYVMEMIKSSFVVRDNPQSESACGCGSSFAVKNFSANPAMD